MPRLRPWSRMVAKSVGLEKCRSAVGRRPSSFEFRVFGPEIFRPKKVPDSLVLGFQFREKKKCGSDRVGEGKKNCARDCLFPIRERRAALQLPSAAVVGTLPLVQRRAHCVERSLRCPVGLEICNHRGPGVLGPLPQRGARRGQVVRVARDRLFAADAAWYGFEAVFDVAVAGTMHVHIRIVEPHPFMVIADTEYQMLLRSIPAFLLVLAITSRRHSLISHIKTSGVPSAFRGRHSGGCTNIRSYTCWTCFWVMVIAVFTWCVSDLL